MSQVLDTTPKLFDDPWLNDSLRALVQRLAGDATRPAHPDRAELRGRA